MKKNQEVIAAVVGSSISSVVSIAYDIIKSYLINEELKINVIEMIGKAILIATIVFVLFFFALKKVIHDNSLILAQKDVTIISTENVKKALLEENTNLNDNIISLKEELNNYKSLCRKNANLISQLKNIEHPSVRKVFNEFGRVVHDKLFNIDMSVVFEILKTDSNLYTVNYIWSFKGRVIKNVTQPKFSREITSDQKINVDTLNLVIKRKINSSDYEILNNNEMGYNQNFISPLKGDIDLEILIANYLMKDDIFEITISYTLVDNYNPSIDVFYVYPFTFDDASCKNLSIEIITHENIVTDALLEYVNEKREIIDKKSMQITGNKYSLLFSPDLEKKSQGYYIITTSGTNH